MASNADEIELEPVTDEYTKSHQNEKHVSIEISDEEFTPLDTQAQLQRSLHRSITESESDASTEEDSFITQICRIRRALVWCCSCRAWYWRIRGWIRNGCCKREERGWAKIQVEWLLLALTLIAFLTFAAPSK